MEDFRDIDGNRALERACESDSLSNDSARVNQSERLKDRHHLKECTSIPVHPEALHHPADVLQINPAYA